MMSARQSSISEDDLTKALISAAGQLGTPAEIRTFVRLLVRDAYGKPLYESPAHKQQAVTSFRETISRGCANGHSSSKTTETNQLNRSYDRAVEIERQVINLERLVAESRRNVDRLPSQTVDCRVIFRNGLRNVYITVREGTVTYAINGTARSAARAMGWIDGQDRFSAEGMSHLLESGLKRC